MTTTLSTFKELAQQAENFGLHPRVQAGDVFWVPNPVLKRFTLSFQSMPDENFHAVIVISVGSCRANARVMTSKVHRYWRDGLPYIPMPDVALRRPGIILTKRCLRRRVPLTSLEQSKYLGNVGTGVLQRIRRQEQGMETENRSSECQAFGRTERVAPSRMDAHRDEALVDRLLDDLRFKAA